MIIRKLFKFENAHIVRNCSTVKCSTSLHGHSYKAEVLFSSNFLDHGQMVYDFGLVKQSIKDIIDAFDHSVSIWNQDDANYITSMKAHSARWVELPVSPSAEQLSRVLFVLIDRLLSLTTMQNGEKEVQLYSIIVHETDTGYAQCFSDDAYNAQMGTIDIKAIQFSAAVAQGFSTPNLYEKIVHQTPMINPTSV